MIDFKNKNIAIVGKGIEGISSEKYLRGKAAKVIMLDEKDNKDYLKNLSKYDLVVRSPGVKLSLLEKSITKEKITSQTKLFFDLCPAKIIGVTGTKGKGTTSSLIYEMLKRQGFDAYLGGNIGVPPFEFLEKLTKDSIVVLELSSFQLIDLDKSPHIAVMLMVTSEHLDWHGSTEEYIEAKRNILKHQTVDDFAILNRDYPASNESDVHSDGKVFTVSRERESFDEGCFVRDGKIWLRIGGEAEIIDVSEILLPGKHNLENVCASVLAATLAGVSVQAIIDVLKNFKGLEHRLELVATINGVKYYDDSFSTTPETTIAAIESFKDPEILILGGSSKNSDFSELGKIISEKENIKALIGIGLEWPKIKSKINKLNPEVLVIEGADSMEKIIKAVSKIATSEDIVLLSPACASFDMFKNYKERGELFKKEVFKLKENESN